MLTTIPILFSLCLASPAAPKLNRTQIYDRENARLTKRYKDDPTSFNPHFLKSDPAAHSVRFGSADFASFASQAKAQEIGAKRHKDLIDSISKPRLPLVLQLQVSYKGN